MYLKQRKRAEAGEISKIFHDVLRYRIERDLINGTLTVKEFIRTLERRKQGVNWYGA